MPTLTLEQISTDGGTQTRAAIHQDAVDDYAEAIQAGTKLPPVTVYHDGAAYWLADGFHRYAAHKKIEAREIEADVRQGEKREAVLHSVGANATHGLRRTTEDKRRAVMLLLEDSEWREWSDREIARRTGVSPSTVGSLRPKASVQVGQIERKVKRGDSEYTMQVQPKTDLSEYRARPKPTYSPPLSPDIAEDGDEPLEGTGQFAQLDKLEAKEELTTQEAYDTVRADLVSAEITKAASKEMPEQTHYTRLQGHIESDDYKRVEFLRKHIHPLASLPPGQLAEDLRLPDSLVLGLPKLWNIVLKEAAA